LICHWGFSASHGKARGLQTTRKSLGFGVGFDLSGLGMALS
jgi:hypothetical protein